MYQVRILNKNRELQAILETENWRYTKKRNQATGIRVSIPRKEIRKVFEDSLLYHFLSAQQPSTHGFKSDITTDTNKTQYAKIAYFMQIYKKNKLKVSGKIIKRTISDTTVNIDAMTEEILLERSFTPAQYSRVFEGMGFVDGIEMLIDNWATRRISTRSQWQNNIDSDNVSLSTEPGQVHLDRDYENEVTVTEELLFNYTGGWNFGRYKDRLKFAIGEGNTIVLNTVESPVVVDSWTINNLPDNFADVTITSKELTDPDSGELTITYDNTGSNNFRPQVTIDYNYNSGKYFESGYIVMRFEKEDITNFKNWERIRWAADNQDPVFTTMQYRYGELGNLSGWSEEFEGIAPDELGVIPAAVDEDILDVKINLNTDDTTSENQESDPVGVSPRLFALEVIARTDSGITAGDIPDFTGINVYDIDADNTKKLSVLVQMCEQAGYDFELIEGELNVAESLGEDRTDGFVLRAGTNMNIEGLSDNDDELVNVLTAVGDGDGINRPMITIRDNDSIEEYDEYPRYQEFKEVTDITELEEKANEYLEVSKLPVQGFRVTAVFSPENEPEFGYGDKIKVCDPRSGIITTAVIDEEVRSFDNNGLHVRLKLNKTIKRLIDSVIEPKVFEKKIVPRPYLSVISKIRGVIIRAHFARFKDWSRTEYHISTEKNFDLSADTLQENKRQKEVEITGLIPGNTYYVKSINYNINNKPSQISRELSFQVGEVEYGDVNKDSPDTPTGLSLSTNIEDVAVQVSANIKAEWDANTEEDMHIYDLRIRKGTGDYSYFTVKHPETDYLFRPLVPNTEYRVNIRAIDVFGNVSAWSAEESITTAKSEVAPNSPTGVNVTPAIRGLLLYHDANTEVDLAGYKVYYNTASGFSGATEYDRGDKLVWEIKEGLTQGVDYWVWVKAFDTTGNQSSAVLASGVPVRPGGETISSYFTIASSDTNAKGIAGADYVCNGTNDHVEINNAISALPANGGKIILLEGTFVVDGSSILNNNVALIGQGDSTIIQAKASSSVSSFDIIKINLKNNVTLKNFVIDNNVSNSSQASDSLSVLTAENIHIENIRTTDGVRGGTLSGVFDSRVIASSFNNHSSVGLRILTGEIDLINNYFKNNGEEGLILNDNSNAKIDQNRFEGNNDGNLEQIALSSCTDTQFLNNNVREGSATVGRVMTVSASSNILVSHNDFKDGANSSTINGVAQVNLGAGNRIIDGTWSSDPLDY